MRLSWLTAVAVLAAGLAACGTQSAAGGPSAANSAPSPNNTTSAAGASAKASGTITPVPAAGSASAGTASAAPAITVTGHGPRSTPTPTRPTGTASVTLTAANRGTVVYLRVGQQVTVVLAPDFGAFHQPSAAGTALRLVSASGGYPGRQPARTVFRAVAPGTATLSAVSDMACLHAHPACMVPQQVWTATVHVSG